MMIYKKKRVWQYEREFEYDIADCVVSLFDMLYRFEFMSMRRLSLLKNGFDRHIVGNTLMDCVDYNNMKNHLDPDQFDDYLQKKQDREGNHV